MQTTLDLDDHLLATAEQMARQQGKTVGEVISQLALQSLHVAEPLELRNGVPLLRRRPSTIRPDLELVNRLRDDEWE